MFGFGNNKETAKKEVKKQEVKPVSTGLDWKGIAIDLVKAGVVMYGSQKIAQGLQGAEERIKGRLEEVKSKKGAAGEVAATEEQSK